MRRWMRWTVPLMLLALLSAPAGAAGGVAPEGPQRLVDGSLFVPKVLQHQWGLRTAPARTRELAATVTLNGKVLPSPDAGGRVQATLAGTVVVYHVVRSETVAHEVMKSAIRPPLPCRSESRRQQAHKLP